MKIIAISDTHSFHRNLVIPDGDVFVCAGDITWTGELDILEDFCNWMSELPHKHKLFIPGNHDGCFQRSWERNTAICMIQDAGGTYLQNDRIVIDDVKFWGSPFVPNYHDWSFMLKRHELRENWALIPDDTNVLISHGPAHGVSDVVMHPYGGVDNAGCIELLYRIRQLKHLKAHIFGHIHSSAINYNLVQVINGITFMNVCSLDSEYKIANPARVIDI